MERERTDDAYVLVSVLWLLIFVAGLAATISLVAPQALRTTAPDRSWGATVFAGTRVPVAILFEHLDAGDRLEDFLAAYPTVTREQALAVLAHPPDPDGGSPR